MELQRLLAARSEATGRARHGTLIRRHEPSAAWIIVALDDLTASGDPPRGVGGTRMTRYGSLVEAVADAQRLAAGMTAKWIALGAPRGGGKAVLALSRDLQPAEREALLDAYGALLRSLGGLFSTGADLGTSAGDMARLAARCGSLIHGIRPDGSSEDAGAYTARGVRAAIEAGLQAIGRPLAGARVHVEGLGHVGAPLARELAAAGAALLLSDLDAARAEALAAETGGRAVAVGANPACEVYAPCARGGTLDAAAAAALEARVIAGSANNQLAAREVADTLHGRDRLYLPDYIVNGGAALAFWRHSEGETDQETLLTLVSTRIGESLRRLIAAASVERCHPLAVAERELQEPPAR